MKDATDFILAFGMLTTGSINSIVTKLADSNCQRDGDNRPLLYDPAATTAPPFWGPAGTTPGVELLYQEDHPLHGYQCVQFNHPFVQAAFMFIGEILCGVLYIGMRCTGRGEPMPYFNPLYLAVAGLCDMTATSMMYVGLTMTYVSTFQVSVRPSVCASCGTCTVSRPPLPRCTGPDSISCSAQILRGFVVVVTAVFSEFVLKRKQQRYHWVGVAMVVVGTVVVGSAPYVAPPLGTDDGVSDASASNPAVGNAIIVLAQIVVGVQMCWEEKYITEYNIPALLVVGWEGLFGLFAIHMLITIVHQVSDFSVGDEAAIYSTPHNATDRYVPPAAHDSEHGWGGGDSNTVFWFGEDDAFTQFKAGKPNNPTLVLAMVCMVFSIAFFNFFGISVTKKMSASHRMVLDSVRTCVVWTVGLVAFGEKFSILQLIGFLILISGSECSA